MVYDPIGHFLVTPVDPEAAARGRRLRELGLGGGADADLDHLARVLAELTQSPYAMVTFLDEGHQYRAGLHTPADTLLDARPLRAAARVLARDHGFCPHVVARRRALVLQDVRDFPRFAGNPLVDESGIRSYLGAPILDRTGLALGAIAAADVRPRTWGRAGLDTVKAMAAELTERFLHRSGDVL
ncbi:GAF domain-containing protein [Streptomyces sp. NPDC060194]|uniref:GAF domain-containing protein n=1 Tax=Streptomyces sp. NPDC060194 TaxID=3347069 RepID=UPI00364E447C